MFHEEGCHGRVAVGRLPEPVAATLSALPGEWLEFDPPSGAIVVRHIQPTSAPTLPTIAHELVRMLAEIPIDRHAGIEGGELFVYSADSPHLVRIRVVAGGGVRIDWAHADFAKARKRPYEGGHDIPIDGVYCRLNGTVTVPAADAEHAARRLQETADTYEGLYPEGDFAAKADVGAKAVTVTMRDVNLDPRLLVERVAEVAGGHAVSGTVDIRSFDDRHPDDRLRLVFQDGRTFVQEPYFWPDSAA